MKAKTTTYTESPAKRITVEVSGNIDQYAKTLLQIFNHTREYPTIFYKVENNAGSDIMVTVNPKHFDSAKAWLSDFGKVTDTEDIIRFSVQIPDYDYHAYEDCMVDIDD